MTPDAPQPDHFGDPALAARLASLLGNRSTVAAATVVTLDGHTTASIGAELAADYEIGSVSKGITALLYRDAVARGEITEDSVLGDFLPLDDSPAARITLASISTHRSGLPRLPENAQTWTRTVALWRHGTNPYGDSLEQLIEQARAAKVGRQKARYSNFAFELLGHSVAAAAGTTYAGLVQDRVAEPLGLDTMYAPAALSDLREHVLTGTTKKGRPQEPWTGEAIAPAGGIRADIASMAGLTRALLDGTAPGMDALEPFDNFGQGARIGAAWMTMRVKSLEVTWHNGGTGGFRSWMGLDRASGRGVVVLSATNASVDNQGFALLAEAGAGT